MDGYVLFQKLFCKYFRHPSLVEAYQSVLSVDGISGFEDFKSKHESYSLAGVDTNPFFYYISPDKRI